MKSTRPSLRNCDCLPLICKSSFGRVRELALGFLECKIPINACGEMTRRKTNRVKHAANLSQWDETRKSLNIMQPSGFPHPSNVTGFRAAGEVDFSRKNRGIPTPQGEQTTHTIPRSAGLLSSSCSDRNSVHQADRLRAGVGVCPAFPVFNPGLSCDIFPSDPSSTLNQVFDEAADHRVHYCATPIESAVMPLQRSL